MRRLFLVPLLAAAALAVAAPSRPSAAPNRPLDVYFVDVEGGAATLIVTPAGESVLIDSGWPRADGRDAKRIEHAARYEAGLDHIDHYVTTHWHVDHYGGIEALTKLMPVRHFWNRGIPAASNDDPENFPTLIAAYNRASGGHSTALKPGDTIPLRQTALPIRLKVLAANGKVIGEGDRPVPISCAKHVPAPIDTGDNGKSVALLLTCGNFKFLDCGDLTWNIKHKLACPKNRVGKVDLFQVTHHGSDLSNNPALVQAIQPRCAVIDNGPRKGGSPKTYATLKSTPSIQGIYQLHRNVETAPSDNVPDEDIANVAEACKGQFIRVRLNPEGSRYTLSIGANHSKQTFDVWE